ncbi:hypothetical protein ARAM_000132 [Aspergillus rambellii]|uniref:Mediator of RNA polymerase II transcription subunit 12 n=1 Tax=Aspergillus rambellii TaxID=308745 RepID=A0A0F8UZF9_9EURO|nr:hypothetical protein ARAM_000132 [Aspergillus rambellii]
MIPHSSAGVQPWGHPLRAVENVSGRIDASQTLGLADLASDKQSMPVLPPQPRHPAVINLTASAGDAQEREPPAKRLRLDASAGSDAKEASPASGSGGEARNNPGSIANPKPASLSWRGRPVWSFQALISEPPNGADPNEEDATLTPQGVRLASPPPFPLMPWRYTPPELSSCNATTSQDLVQVKQVQTTPYRIEVPSAAPVLKGDKVADFSPWTGNHPEDVLNEQTAKQGHYDRTQVSQNESNTARPSLYAQLKHRSGLHMLSSVFMAALEKRQTHNMVTAPSSFKPPPRVTLTDNKRELWLRDLANPSVPLRRLSRTIPHGIRGKALLDQCLSKWIPISRAVWLAKCVGANEIRAFKRKGTSGALAMGLEAKWVRDWTTGVQQFLEAVVGTCGSGDWKSKMTYAATLTARLFFERLLDHDQYITWFLASLESASLNVLPVWLLMLGIYWGCVLRYRKRGRRLAEILLEKLRQITQPRKPTSLQPLADRLSSYIKRLVLEHTSSVILPTSWERYKDLIYSCLNMKEQTDRAVFATLAERNSRVQVPKDRPETTQSAQHRVINLFDSIRSSHDISSTATACLTALEDKAALVFKLLEWSASPFRFGLGRVYTAARLLRKWKTFGVDIDSHIISFLGTVQDANQLSMENVYHVISELVRSQNFSISRYLQWLMAKGVANTSGSNNAHILSGDACLLSHLPMSRLPEHVRSLRHTLLFRAGISGSDEEITIEALKNSISRRLPKIFGAEMSNGGLIDASRPNLSWAVKSEVGIWIRSGVAKHYRDSSRKLLGDPLPIRVSALTPEEFYNIRDILESFGDLSILADVIKQATRCDDNVVLASAADTINYHFDAFGVIGATGDLFRGLLESYARLKRMGTLHLDFVFSLIELGLRIPHEMNMVTLLRQDLARMESKSALAAPSPLSDHIPMTLGEVDSSFQDKLDQLLSSGNGMDESTMSTVFGSLTRLLDHGSDASKLSANDICRYLAYVRPFNPKYFDALLLRWVCGLLKSPSQSMMARILPPLIGVGCVTIHGFVNLVNKLLAPEKATPAVFNPTSLRLDLLELLIPRESKYADMVTYRFCLAQQEFLAKHPKTTLDIIRDAIPLIDSQYLETEPVTSRPDLAGCTTALLHTLLSQASDVVAQYCMQKFTVHPAFTSVLEKAVDVLLGFDSSSASHPVSEAEKVILMNNDFSLPFCQLKLQLLFNAGAGDDVKNSIVDVMFKAAVADSRSKNSHWIGLVNLMNQDAARQIRERAESSFFAIPLFDERADDASISTVADYSNSIENAKLYLGIIEKLAYSVPESGVQSVVPILVEKMDHLLQRLIIMQTNFTSFAENRHGISPDQIAQYRLNFERGLAFWFSALLRVTVLHRTAFTAPASLAAKTNNLHEQTRLLVSMFCISLARLPDNILRFFPTANYFPHPVPPEKLRPCPGILLQTHALDVAASLIDSFPDETRQQCARFLREKCPPFLQFQNDPRFLYLLGPMPDATAPNLPIPASLPSPAAGGSTPTPSGSLPSGASNNQAPPMAACSGIPYGTSDGVNCASDRLRLQHRGRIIGPYPVRPWELLEDAAPILGVNDTAVSLKLFDTRSVRA